MVNSPLYPACTIGVWTAWVNSCESTSPVALGQFISNCPRLTATCIAVGCLLARNWPSVMQPAAVSAARSVKILGEFGMWGSPLVVNIFEVFLTVYWTLVQYGGRRREGRLRKRKIRVPSTLITRHSPYFGGSCVPTMSVRTVVPSGFGLYLTNSSRLPFVYPIEFCSLPAKRDVGCQPWAAMTS